MPPRAGKSVTTTLFDGKTLIGWQGNPDWWSVQDGAIHLTFGNKASSSIKGKLLTIRPAVVEDAPIVPIAWVCGNSAVPDKMTVKGVNKTNIPPLFLPLKCRAL